MFPRPDNGICGLDEYFIPLIASIALTYKRWNVCRRRAVRPRRTTGWDQQRLISYSKLHVWNGPPDRQVDGLPENLTP